MKQNIVLLIGTIFVLNSCGGDSEGKTTTKDIIPPHTSKYDYVLTAWNDLGMHCMDGNDFSVFSILPPYNNLHAQLKDKNGGLVRKGVVITYEATTGLDGKVNSSSANKTNFRSMLINFFQELN